VYYRNFWGKSQFKKDALLASLLMERWSTIEKTAAAASPAGPREYERFVPTEEKRWKLVPFENKGGFEDWPALDELFRSGIQGVNPNRGLQGSVVDMNKSSLHERMQQYFSDLEDEEIRERYPVLFTPRARYVPEAVRARLRETSSFDPHKIVPYVVFPLDIRWLYYETAAKLLNEARADLFKNLHNNEFLVAVPEPRQYSEIRPLLLSCTFDLHLHDRGSIGFPMEIKLDTQDEAPLFQTTGAGEGSLANIAEPVWACLKEAWDLRGSYGGHDAKRLVRQLASLCVAVCHSPLYEQEHKEALAQDWAHVPIPKNIDLFVQLANAGSTVALLLDPAKDPTKLFKEILGESLATIAVVNRLDGEPIQPTDLTVEYSFFGSATGGWRSRSAEPEECFSPAWGETTGDLFINDRVCLRNVPQAAWEYELGGYPVIKKWLGYRDHGRRGDAPLSVQEINHLRNMVQRIAALLVFHSTLDQLYEAASGHSFTVDEFAESNEPPKG
jgi:hypothetical protein